MKKTNNLKCPFPWFGGKSRVSSLVWERFGDVQNYVEPFAGSLAVLLGRPHDPRIETVNDLDCHLANFWRAVKDDPKGVVKWADGPVNEADQHARHTWLVNEGAERVERLKTDPHFYDSKVAGWWVWGLCTWIGSGWCKRPHLGNAGMGVHRKRPHLGNAGMVDYFSCLTERLRRVRVCCGDWTRVLGPTPTVKQGTTAVLLDPPYGETRTTDLYNIDSVSLVSDVSAWAIENGTHKDFRIAFCGYEGEVVFPDDWSCIEWKTQGGYGSQANDRARENATRERIWFSPHCLKVEQYTQVRLI